MSRSRRRGHGGEHENDERWLLTYADMITLLMALFMVLFSISSVNVSKYQTLQQALHAAFSGQILPGGQSVASSGATTQAHRNPDNNVIQAIAPVTPAVPTPKSTSAQQHAQVALQAAAQREQDTFIHLKMMLDAYAKVHGFSGQVQTIIKPTGLLVRILTDRLLFDSGSADLQPEGLPLLVEISHLLNIDQTHQILVTGYTDNVPISTSQFPSNWELSTTRAGSVVRFLIGHSVSQMRLEASGYAALHPIASNATAGGRALNRRVEVLIQRKYPFHAS
jgi:chemotaxis protein MotB